MFDVGFSEMMVVAIVALIVIGPERLPKVARTLGHLVGRLQRYVRDVKADINREMELDELRKFKEEFQSGAQAVEQTIRGELQNAEANLRSVADEATPLSAGPASEHVPAVSPVSEIAEPPQQVQVPETQPGGSRL
jgi:sec-independent protein translocase protein TatB